MAFLGERVANLAAAMVGWTLVRAGHDPTVALGVGAPQLGGTNRAGSGPHRIIRADPASNATTSAVYLGRIGEGCERSLGRLAPVLSSGGFLIATARAAGSCPRIEGLETLSARRRGSDWWAADLKEERGRFRFRAFHRGRFAAEVRLATPGRGAVLAALAALAACARLDVPTPAIRDGLEDFRGVSGRLEDRGGFRGATFLVDRSSGARPVAEALKTCRLMFGARRLLAVFAGGKAGRPGPEILRLAGALSLADGVVLVSAPPATALRAALGAAGVPALEVGDLDEAIRELDRNLEPGDVLLAMGPGDVGKVADAFTRRLPGDRPGR